MKKIFALVLAMAMTLCAGCAMANVTVKMGSVDAESGTHYTLDANVLTIMKDGLTVSGSPERIIVNSGVKEVTFSGVSVTTPGSGNSALEVQGGDVKLIFEGENTLKGGNREMDAADGDGGAGINARDNVTVSGNVTATGGNGGRDEDNMSGDGGAGINAGGNVTVSGNVTATGGNGKGSAYGGVGGAGINAGGNVTLSGDVTATGGIGGISFEGSGGDGGAGINAMGNVTLSGDVTATGGAGGSNTYGSGGVGGAGIYAVKGIVTLSGDVTAKGGIGGGGDVDGKPGSEGSFSEEQVKTMDQYPTDDHLFVYKAPAQNAGSASEPIGNVNLPRTGDPSSLMGWTALLFASAAGLKMRRKK